jgi:hypothetical protein
MPVGVPGVDLPQPAQPAIGGPAEPVAGHSAVRAGHVPPEGLPGARALADLGLRAPAVNWRPWRALAAAHLMAYGDTLVRDAELVPV